MAQRKPQTTKGSNGSAKGTSGFCKEAFEYNDDVTVEAVQKLHTKVNVDFGQDVWKTIDGFGRVLNA